jgi:hypothetical protein
MGRWGMRKYSALLFCLAILSLPAAAGPPELKSIPYPNTTDSIVIPADSPVHYSGIMNKDGENLLTFQGRFLLTGTFYYGDNDFNDSGDDHPSEYVFDPQAYIIPDDNVAARLPRFAIRNGRQTIIISNPTIFANAAISKTEARRVRRRNCGDVTGYIAIWVDQFSAGIDCDAPTYVTRFLSVDKPTTLALAPKPDRAC